MSVAYVPTINVNAQPTTSIWCTVDFGISYRDVLTFCGDGAVEERGDIEVIYFGPPGTGFESLLTAAEADLKTLLSQRDPSNKLLLVNRSEAEEFTGGDSGQDYGLSFFVEFLHYE